MATKEDDFVEHLFIASTHDYILFFTQTGQCHWLRVHEIPQAGRAAKGKAIVNLLELGKDESIAAFIAGARVRRRPLPRDGDEEGRHQEDAALGVRAPAARRHPRHHRRRGRRADRRRGDRREPRHRSSRRGSARRSASTRATCARWDAPRAASGERCSRRATRSSGWSSRSESRERSCRSPSTATASGRASPTTASSSAAARASSR